MSGQGVREAKSHGGHVVGGEAWNQSGQVLADSTVDVSGGGIRNWLNVQAGELANGIAYIPNISLRSNSGLVSMKPEITEHTQLGISNSQRNFLLVFD